MMGFNLFMSRQQVIEKYGIAPELEPEIFAMLKPVGGAGANAQYLESRVDQQLEKYFADKERLQGREAWSYSNKEDQNVIEAIRANNQLADVLREVFEWVKPRLDTVLSERTVADQGEQTAMLTPEQVAQRLGVHVQTVMKWCRQRDKASCPLSASKLARKWLIPKEAVDAALRKAQMIHGRAG